MKCYPYKKEVGGGGGGWAYKVLAMLKGWGQTMF